MPQQNSKVSAPAIVSWHSLGGYAMAIRVSATNCICCIMAIGLSMAAPGTSMAQSSGLRNKTIIVRNTGLVTATVSTGVTGTAQFSGERIIYVDSLGRVFGRLVGAFMIGVSSVSFAEDQAPGRATKQRQWHVVGNTLVSRQTKNGIYDDLSISFNSDYTNCMITERALNIVGPSHGANGVIVHMSNITRTSSTCSVREGNPFAD